MFERFWEMGIWVLPERVAGEAIDAMCGLTRLLGIKRPAGLRPLP